MKRKIGVILLAISMILMLAACGKSSDDNWKNTNGEYYAAVTLEGGSGRATIASPALVTVSDGKITATIVWSSPNYDYMIVDGVKYINEAAAGENSTFTFPISEVPCTIDVIADTTAMSKPHEIEYKISFSFEEIKYSELEKTGSLELKYATGFSVTEYGPVSEIDVKDGERYLVVPGGMKITDVPEGIIVLEGPFDNTYLVATSAADMIASLGALGNIGMSGTKSQDWYIDDMKKAMDQGDIVYAGKYSAPDYELILSRKCKLAIESTMINHNPEVKEKLEELGIPVMVERSSYENHPFGRMEWIKVYGILFGKTKEACQIFDEHIEKVLPIFENENTDKTVAFFYVNAAGVVNVRKPNDYVAQMIELAGGEYALADCVPTEENAMSTMNMQMEDFYANAKNADFLIYNSTIEGELNTLEDLTKLNSLFEDFEAVKKGNVYCTSGNFFQETMGSCDFIEDLNKLMNGGFEDGYYFLKKLE